MHNHDARPCYNNPGEGGSLSPGERAGVGNGPYSNLISQTLAGTVKLFESSGRTGRSPSGLKASLRMANRLATWLLA